MRSLPQQAAVAHYRSGFADGYTRDSGGRFAEVLRVRVDNRPGLPREQQGRAPRAGAVALWSPTGFSLGGDIDVARTLAFQSAQKGLGHQYPVGRAVDRRGKRRSGSGARRRWPRYRCRVLAKRIQPRVENRSHKKRAPSSGGGTSALRTPRPLGDGSRRRLRSLAPFALPV